MNEMSNALRVMNTAIKTVRIMNVLKRITVFVAVIICSIFAFRFFRK